MAPLVDDSFDVLELRRRLFKISRGLNAFHRRAHIAHAQRDDFVHELDHDERAEHDDGELHHGVDERAILDRGGHRLDAVLRR